MTEQSEKEYLLESVEVAPGLAMPRTLAAHWEEIRKTAKPFVSITAAPNESPALRASKFGHYPLLPEGFDYPKDPQGNYMFPLAQINFAEFPALPGYPDSGYLQFYLSASDDYLYGIDFDAPQTQTGFRVLFFTQEEINNSHQDMSFLDEFLETSYSPVHKPSELSFEHRIGYIGSEDCNCNCDIESICARYPLINEELYEYVGANFQITGHRIGGYAYFTQWDPRTNIPEWKDYVLLLQIDSDEGIMWGDTGVGNFFIHPDDLAKKDFSKVLYNWDCG